MRDEWNSKSRLPHYEFSESQTGIPCGEVFVFCSEASGYCVVKVFATRQAAERELELVLAGFKELGEGSERQQLDDSIIGKWIRKSRTSPISPDGCARFAISGAVVYR